MRDIYDDILDDIEKQEKKNPTQFDIIETETDFDDTPQDLLDVGSYNDEETLNEDDFDITYRTPEWAFDDNKRSVDLLVGNVLPEEIIVTDNIEKELEKKDKQYPRITKFAMENTPIMPYDEIEKHEKYNEKIKSNPRGSPLLYDGVFGDIYYRDDVLASHIKNKKFIKTLAHENIHKLERDLEVRTPQPRVWSEPGPKLFNAMHENDVIRTDLSNFLRSTPIGNKDRKQTQKNRARMLDNFENNYPFREQLAYFGEHNIRQSVRNPKSATQRTLNRMWFQ